MNRKQIVAIVLIKNEDLFIKKVLENILVFCDRVYVADNRSTDQTPQIIKGLAEQHGKIEYRCVDHIPESHDMIADYAGTETWMIGVDGDEVYDPEGLRHLREDLFNGRYDNYFKISGNVLHVRQLDIPNQTARGYLTPPCRSVTKLYNFNAIHAWRPPCPERLHGGSVDFKPGFSHESVGFIMNDYAWESSPFRCLHLCFTHRSSIDVARKSSKVRIRKGVGERLLWRYNLRSWIKSFFGYEDIPLFKRDYYMRGSMVEKNIQAFGL